jgi:hypothetical protein
MLSKVFRAVLPSAAVLSVLVLPSSPALAQTPTLANTDAQSLVRGLDFGVATPLALQGGATAQAQATAQVREADAGIGFGVIYGIVRPSFKDDDAEFTLSNKTGWKVGIFFGGNRDGTVGFWGKLLYKVKKSEATVFGQVRELEARYLEIPAGFRVNIGSSSRNSIVGFVDFGAVVDINIKKLDDANIPEDYLGTELGYYFGVGVEITRLIVELRWDRMVKSFYDPEEGFESIKGHEFEVEFMFRIN